MQPLQQEVSRFLREALAAGKTPADIEAALGRAGWEAEERRQALQQFVFDSGLGMAVPRKKPSLNAREAFLYLLLFAMLSVSAFSLGGLVFQLINTWLPDAALDYTYYGEGVRRSMRMSIASLVVAFPVFAYLNVIVSRLSVQDASHRSSPVRKWLTYLTLFVSACTIIGSLVSILYNFLDGELTLRFFLKAMTVLLIAAGIFGFYLSDIRKDERA